MNQIIYIVGLVPALRRQGRAVALGVSLVELVLAVIAATTFDWSTAGTYQLVETASWIPQIGVSWALGVNALGLVMVLLATALVPLVLLAGWREDEGGDEGGRPQVPDHGSDATPVLGERGESGPGGGHTVTTDEVVMSAVLAETSLDPALAREDLTLAGDLDLDTIGLYAVVTSIEHGLGAQFRDVDVEAWQTLGDVLAASRGVVGD